MNCDHSFSYWLHIICHTSLNLKHIGELGLAAVVLHVVLLDGGGHARRAKHRGANRLAVEGDDGILKRK